MNSELALITGSSSGIGLHLAREFAAHGHPLVLVAPVESELRSVASQIVTSFAVDVRVIAKDRKFYEEVPPEDRKRAQGDVDREAELKR